jgi:uncharacterized membrane protein YkvA (DUF1232 family)
MAGRVTPWLTKPWALPALWREVKLAIRLFREPRVPLLVRGTIPLALLYVISPVDLLPDFIPGIGQIDDLVLLYAAVRLFIRLCPLPAVDFHRRAIQSREPFSPMPSSGVVIDADFRRDT